MTQPPPFARRLTELRLAAGFETQASLAAEAGVSAAAISAIEQGTNRGRDETFAQLCRVLGARRSGEPVRPLSDDEAAAWWLLRLDPVVSR